MFMRMSALGSVRANRTIDTDRLPASSARRQTADHRERYAC